MRGDSHSWIFFHQKIGKFHERELFLENTNHNRFIGSNSGKERIIRGLKKVGIDRYFNEDSISSFDLVGKSKPEPDVFQRLIDIANLGVNNQINFETIKNFMDNHYIKITDEEVNTIYDNLVSCQHCLKQFHLTCVKLKKISRKRQAWFCNPCKELVQK